MSSKADVLIHLHNHMNDVQSEDLKSHINKIPGVIQADYGPSTHHAFHIEYDPVRVSASTLLRHARESDDSATMIGL
ncbi:MAG: hypothetical protein HUJ30_04395 [Gammaproteobacteria bacterium]|nr:hypothetical protein [Gammaproteobacteria bacterium]